MNNNKINKPIRNLSIEQVIDEKLITQSLSRNIENLSVYLNVLEKLIDEHNNEGSIYKDSRLKYFIIKKIFILEKYELDALSEEEKDYSQSIAKHLENIRDKFGGERFHYNRILHIIEILEKSSEKQESISSLIENELPIHYRQDLQIHEKKRNIYIFLARNNYIICLIRNEESFEIIDQRYLCSIIVDTPHPDIYSRLEKHPNIDLISYRNRFNKFNRIRIRTPLEECASIIDGLIFEANTQKTYCHSEIIKTLYELNEEIKRLEHDDGNVIIGSDTLKLEDIKQLRKSIQNSSYRISKIFGDDKYNKLSGRLKKISSILSLTFNRIVNALDLDDNINFSLSEIRRNNTLYIASGGNRKNSDYVFGEENLTSILASNLRCLYRKHNYISVNCEAMVGNGRSDIRLSFKNVTFGLVESKLIKQNSNIFQESLNAIDQLFSRYSENENTIGDPNMKLYLIIFTYDKSFPAIHPPITDAALSYSNRNGLNFEGIEKTENGIKFSYCEDRGILREKKRTISILICNMEVDYKTKRKQRTRNDTYNPSN